MDEKEKDLKPVYCLYGDDEFLIDEELRAIKKAALKGAIESLNYNAFELKGSNPSEIISIAETYPAMSPRRLIVVTGAESFKGDEDEDAPSSRKEAERIFAGYIRKPLETTCLVFVAKSAKLPKNDFTKALEEKKFLKPCAKPKGQEIASWIKKEAKALGKPITDAAAQKLLAISGGQMREIRSELEKIIIFAGDKKAVDESDVEGAGLDCKEETVFGLSDAIGVKDMKKAFQVYSKLEHEYPAQVLGAITRQIRILLKIKALKRKGVSDQALASMAGIPPYFVGKYVASSKRFSEAELKRAYKRLFEADTDLKTGRVPQAHVVPNLIIDLCGNAGC